METNIQKLRPIELCRLLNSTSLGDVIKESRLRNHRTQAGLSIGSQRSVNLLRYAAWLVQQRPAVRGEPAKPITTPRTDTPESNVALAPPPQPPNRPQHPQE